MNNRLRILLCGISALLVMACGSEDLVKTSKLFSGEISYNQMLDFAGLSQPSNAEPVQTLSGNLTLNDSVVSGGFELVRDDFGIISDQNIWQKLPKFDFSFVISEGNLLPVERSIILRENSHVDIMLQPGRAWRTKNEPDVTYMSLPFTLLEKLENCAFNGVLLARVENNGNTSAIYQIASETCMYIKFNAWGQVAGNWVAETNSNMANVIGNYNQDMANRLPTLPIGQLAIIAQNIDIDKFSEPNSITPDDLSAYGVVYDGVHYVSNCVTRAGDYPYCDEMILPSYSLAKSMVGSLALMRLEKLYPNVSQALISDYVPACAALPQWQGVTFENALDMATGNYNYSEPIADEASAEFIPFFPHDTHAGKINFSCSWVDNKSEAGTHFTYHTSDTYILGTALQAFWRTKSGEQADFYNDIVLEQIFRPLGLSQNLLKNRRASGVSAPVYTGYGIFMERGDLALLASYLASGDQLQLFAADMLASTLQQNPNDRGLVGLGELSRYQNGFWASEVSSSIACEQEKWLPVMSGYGGISVVMTAKGSVYYNFSDGNKFAYLQAVAELNKLNLLC